MATARNVTVSLLLLLPATALAHGPNDGPDPDLHVDASLDDCSVIFASELSQSAYARFTREFGSVSAFKQGSPPTTLGQWGFAVDLEQLYFTVEEHSDAWNDTFAHPDAWHELGSDKAFPKLRLRLGVTDDLDVGIYYTEQPAANYGWLGFEGKYGLLKQSEEMPIALAVRGAYTKTLYVDDMDMHALGADVTVGRTFWEIVTPYAGVGADAVLARETSDDVELDTEVVLAPHLIGGLEARYWHVALGVEGQLAAIPTLQIQLSAVF